DVHKGVNFQDMFNGNVSQNSDLSDWSMSNATSLSGMFLTSSFNNNVNTWDVSKVTTFFNMFSSGAFNQPISGWSTACATTFQGMFQNNGNFNQPVNTLNTSKITNMTNMFSGASTFDQPCDFNDISKVTFVGFNGFAKNSGMSPTNYDKTLNKWANSSPVANAILVRFDPTQYTAAAANAREYLVNTKGWTITDGGLL
ncbi:MAG TPA: BspA family leucine-rich repeat surface protein, partial [Pirellulales bacterium]|nr:BspA family leucine-rich repeat surface protein [Pirellulales bacterium]